MTLTRPLDRLHELPSNSVEAVDTAVSPEIESAINDWVASALSANTKVIYLVGCGGSLFAFGPMKYLLERSGVPAVTMNAAEFVLRRPENLGPDSIVITASTNGGTREVVDTIKLAEELRAPLLLVTGKVDSLVGQATTSRIVHRGVEGKQLLLSALALALCKAQGLAPDYDDWLDALRGARGSFERAVAACDDELAAIAQDLKDAPCIYVLGSGPLQGAAETFAACYLQEMQLRHAIPIGSNEFLHGPFEVTDGDLPVILFKNAGGTRAIDERTEEFLRQHNKRTHIIDVSTLEVDLPEGPQADWIRTCIAFTSIIARLAQHFEDLSGRPLMDRRYMWKIDY